MNSVADFWLRLRNRLRFGLAIQEVLDRLARLRVVIYPYFLVYEPIVARPEAEVLEHGLRIVELSRKAASLLATVPERPRDEAKLRELMERASCVAVMEGDELLAYTWFRLQQLRGPVSANTLCDLPPHWAYLFDMYVRPKARGRRLAVAMRHRVHQLLAERGVQHCCSITLLFNRSSRRFKARLGASEMELRLVLRLGALPGLDLRLWRKPWPLATPLVDIARPAQRGAQ